MRQDHARESRGSAARLRVRQLRQRRRTCFGPTRPAGMRRGIAAPGRPRRSAERPVAIQGAQDRYRPRPRAGAVRSDGLGQRIALARLGRLLGRATEVVGHRPFSQREIARQGGTTFIERLFSGTFGTYRTERLGAALAGKIVAGGYPPAVVFRSVRRRLVWYRDYAANLIYRDIRDLGRIRSLESMPKLLSVAADQSGQLFNLANLAAPFQIGRNTVRDYFTLLEGLFLVERLPPWRGNLSSRLVKVLKVHLGDSGLAGALLGVDAKGLAANRPVLGQVLETFAFQELRRQAGGLDGPYSFFRFRDRDGAQGRHRHRARHLGGGRRRDQARRHRVPVGFPGIAQAQVDAGQPVRRGSGALRRRDLREHRRRSLRCPDTSALGVLVMPGHRERHAPTGGRSARRCQISTDVGAEPPVPRQAPSRCFRRARE